MIPLPPKVKLVLGVLLAGLLAAGGYWQTATPSVPAWLPPIMAMLVFLEGFVTVPQKAAKKITDLTAKLAGMTGALFLAGVLTLSQVACIKGASFPSLDKVEAVVLQDLASCGTSNACVGQMEADVATLIGQGELGPSLGTDAVAIVRSALQLLIDAGVIPANVLPKAKACLHVEKLKLVKLSAEAPDAGGE